MALVNGGDDESLKVLRAREWVQIESRPGRLRPIGPAVSELMELARDSDRSMIFHLEDDWGCRAPVTQWLDRAALLLRDPRIGQVRLRLASEKVLTYNMVTRQGIRWRGGQYHRQSSNAHFTFNPNLMRASDCARVYPCKSEPDAQRNFAKLGCDVVQLLPGVFAHLGGEQSLRMLLR